MADKRQSVKSLILELAAVRGEIANRDVAAATGLTRQGVHHHLTALVAAGELVRLGAGRSTRYRMPADFDETLAVPGLEEHIVWLRARRELEPLERLPINVRDIVGYGFTEMLNNAIDHSGSDRVRVGISATTELARFEVRDWGVGAFRHVAEHRGLATYADALLEIAKGKTTTMPEAHSGEGIFFTSKAMDVFELESNGLAWVVDNTREDQASGSSDVMTGTRVRARIAASSTRQLARVFERYTVEDEFARSRIAVRLAEVGEAFVSRSEAKRIAHGLERFREVIVDFSGVRLVGQAFADELFRVWARRNPDVSLHPHGMSEGVRAMVMRATGAPGR